MVTGSKDASSLCFSTFISPSLIEPTSYKEALQSPHWVVAMQTEFQALQNQHTWTLVHPSTANHVIGCKWVFRIKKHSDGTIARYKARLVATGYLQKEGVDFHDTFSPVAKQLTVKILFCLTLHFNWPIR